MLQDGQSAEEARLCPVCRQGTLRLAAFRDFQGFRCSLCPHDQPVAPPRQASLPAAVTEALAANIPGLPAAGEAATIGISFQDRPAAGQLSHQHCRLINTLDAPGRV